jgi:hypothetical protein
MAIARCETCGRPQGLKRSYIHYHALSTSFSLKNKIFCGAPACVHPGCIWLTDEEEQQYLGGRRGFRVTKRAREVLVR